MSDRTPGPGFACCKTCGMLVQVGIWKHGTGWETLTEAPVSPALGTPHRHTAQSLGEGTQGLPPTKETP